MGNQPSHRIGHEGQGPDIYAVEWTSMDIEDSVSWDGQLAGRMREGEYDPSVSTCYAHVTA
jgi:hypothetical protein